MRMENEVVALFTLDTVLWIIRVVPLPRRTHNGSADEDEVSEHENEDNVEDEVEDDNDDENDNDHERAVKMSSIWPTVSTKFRGCHENSPLASVRPCNFR